MRLENIKKVDERPGIFTIDGLDQLFSIDSLKPWKDLPDHTCFLLALTTGTDSG